MCLGVFTEEQRGNMLRIMGGILARKDVPASVKVSAFRAISQEGQFVVRAFLDGFKEIREESGSGDEYHSHLHGDGSLSPADQMIAEMTAMMDAGMESREPDEEEASEASPPG